MVVAPQPEAVDVAADILRMGGNAVDAAIACALVQGVVDPQMTGIAGFGSLHLYLPQRGVHEFIDFHGRTPQSATPTMWTHLLRGETRDGFGFILDGNVNDVGYQSITTPGSLKAYHEAQTTYGSLPWEAVVEPATGFAEDGFVVRPQVHWFWTFDDGSGRVANPQRMKFCAAGRSIYCDADGELLKVGGRVRNPHLAQTLRRIAAEGADCFYTGSIAREIDADMRAHGGMLSMADLASYRTRRNAPLRGRYRGYDIATNHPPGGGIMLVEMLGVLEHFDLAALGHNSAAYIRVLAEAMKQATADKDAFVGDPDFVEIPVQRLISPAYAAEQAARIKRGEKAVVPRINAGETKNTTQVCVLDEHGNAVSMTHSLGSPSGVITAGLGFMYNGAMGVFDPRPGRAGSITPGKARFSSLCPSILFRDRRPEIVIGAPGGTQIAMGVLQVILNLIDHGMSPVEAVSAARVSATSNAIDIANRVPRTVEEQLTRDGYEVIRSPLSYTIAGVHVIAAKGEDPAAWRGGADPAYDGMALAV